MSDLSDSTDVPKGLLLERAIRLHHKKLSGNDDEAFDKSRTLPPLANQSDLSAQAPRRRRTIGEHALWWLGIRRANDQDRTSRS